MEVLPEAKEQEDGRKPNACRRVFASLRFRLLLLILLVAIPALVVTVSTILAWKRHERAEARAYILMLTQVAAQHQEQIFQATHELLVGMAQVSAGRENGETACTRLLASLQAVFPSYARVGVVRSDATVACGTLPAQGPTGLKGHPLFRRVMDTRRFALGEHRIDPVTGKAAMRFAGPIFDGAGRIRAVGFGDLEMDWLAELIRTSLWPAGTTVTLIDRDGVIAAREPNSREWVGRTAGEATVFQTARHARSENTAVGYDLDGNEKLFAFTPLQGPLFGGTLLLVLGLPVLPAFAEANNILVRNLVALGGTTLLVIVLAWVGSTLFVLRRVGALVGMARRLTAGDLTARSSLPHGPGELNQLAGAFDVLAADLEKRQTEADRAKEALREAHDELDRRVQERTADLSKANAALQETLRDLRQTEEHLREHEAQLAAIIGSATDGVITIDANRRVLLFNQAAERIFRLPAAKAIGQPAEQLVPERFRGLFRRVTREGGAIGPQVGRHGPAAGLRADGEEFPIEAATSLVTVRGKSLYTIILRDITRRRRTEEALLRLNAQLEREAERIAHALHDDAGQFLTSAHIALAGVARGLPPAVQERLLEVREHLNQVEEQLRSLSRELRPRILEDLGLPAALKFLADGVNKRTGIAVGMEDLLEERLPPIVETTLYRLVQEALTNASRHAHATRIAVRIVRDGRGILCEIRDDGIGFNAPEIFARQGDSSLGLIGIRDRLEALGGTLQINSTPGQGTEIVVRIPLEN